MFARTFCDGGADGSSSVKTSDLSKVARTYIGTGRFRSRHATSGTVDITVIDTMLQARLCFVYIEVNDIRIFNEVVHCAWADEALRSIRRWLFMYRPTHV